MWGRHSNHTRGYRTTTTHRTDELSQVYTSYRVWDSAEDMVSEFVTLAIQSAASSKGNQFTLNFQEMRMACIFRTMTMKHLEECLPDGVKTTWAGRPLRVVPPIWQGFTGDLTAWKVVIGGTETFEHFLNSPNPAIRTWAWNFQHVFNDLWNSCNDSEPQYCPDG